MPASSPDRRTIVFVYGTLKQGYGNHRRLEGSEYLGEAQTLPSFKLLAPANGGFPYLVRQRGGTGVWGELYRVDEATLASLDALEGHPRFYTRTTVHVMHHGHLIDADVYLYPRPLERQMKDWGDCWDPQGRRRHARGALSA